jgi:NADH dehydrogenase
MNSHPQKVIVVGAGFAGIQFIRSLKNQPFEILLIDKINHHQFQPLFYQVATSQIEPASISFPIRNIFHHQKNVKVRMAEVLEIQEDNNRIVTTIGEFNYDILVLAMGCKTNFFGNTEIEKQALTLKSTYEAINIRNHILNVFEQIAANENQNYPQLFNIVIVGAGPTGVELAGAFAEIKREILPKDYPDINFNKLNIYLIEGSNHTLNNLSVKSKKESEKYLKNLGVKVLTNSIVSSYQNKELKLKDGTIIKTATLIWAAGVTGNSNRVKVNRLNKVISTQNIYAIGDIAYMETPLYPKGHPQVANVAINQAKNLANNLIRLHKKKSANEYEYKDLGSMATIGRNKAVVDLPFMHLRGYLAWLIWMFLHLMLILSVKNKLIIFINWAWAYITKNTSLRLILNNKNSV